MAAARQAFPRPRACGMEEEMDYITEVLGNLVEQTAFFSGLTVGNHDYDRRRLRLFVSGDCKGLRAAASGSDFFWYAARKPVSADMEEGGLLWYFFKLDEWSIFPSLIFMGVGAMTDFGPLIANPSSFILGAAAQFGIFFTYIVAIAMGFGDKAAAAISIIGGADGPTSLFLATKLGQTELMGPIAVAAYSYMSLVPIIQPPIMRLLTTKKERVIKMEQLRPVSKLEKILFPIVVTIVVVAILPTTCAFDRYADARQPVP